MNSRSSWSGPCYTQFQSRIGSEPRRIFSVNVPISIMAFRLFNLLILIPIFSIGHPLKINKIGTTTRSSLLDMAHYMSSYYDVATGLELKGELQDAGRNPLQAPKIIFQGLPCFCGNLTCGCCAGINLTTVNFNRRACTKFSYNPNEFAINMAFSMNENEVFSSSFSAKNPPPICIPFTYFPAITFCARFFDIHTPGRNLHACLDFETRVVNSPILVLHFNCVKLGADGISLIKPGENVLNLLPTEETTEPEIYDEVDFEQADFEEQNNYGTTLSPEEESSIGQLKYESLF